MKVLGKVTSVLIQGIFEERTYLVIRRLSKTFDIPDFLEEEKVLDLPKENMLAMMVSEIVYLDKVKVIIGDIGIEEFCEHWSDHIAKVNESLRVEASGEFDVLNMKINYVVNKFIKQRS